MNRPQLPAEMAQANATEFETGINSSNATDGSLLNSDQDLLRILLEPLLRGTKQRLIIRRITRKIESALEKPNINVNELFDGQSILHIACRYGQSNLVMKVLKRPDADVNIKNSDGLTGLHIACRAGSYEHVVVVEALLESPHIDVNIRDPATCRTPLHIAALQGNQASMKMLLKIPSIDLQSTDTDGYLPVHYAAAHPMSPVGVTFAEDIEAHDTNEILLRLCKVEDINAKTSQGLGLLHLAAQAGNTRALKVLLARPGLDINMVETHGNTALHLVEDASVAGILLGGGMDANVQNADGNTALHLALERSMAPLVDLFLQHTNLDGDIPNKKGDRLMHIAAAKCDPETFDWITATCLPRDVNVPGANGETVLHIAARVWQINIAKRLLNMPGIDLNAQDDAGRTPLHLSCEQGHLEFVQCLLDDPFTHVNARDRWRQTPLHIVCKEGHSGIVRLLLSHVHTDAEPTDLRGWTPLHYASQSAYGEPIVSDLLKFTLDVDKKGLANGETALHVAALGGRFNIVRNLLEQGADPHITCTGLVGSDSCKSQDAAGVASKMEIVDLIRDYRWRKPSIIPDPLSDSQKTLLASRASDVCIFWVWPRADDHGIGSRPRRRGLLPDIRAVHEIYDNLADPDPYSEIQGQLKSSSLKKNNNFDKQTITGRNRATKWVHFSAQSVSPKSLGDINTGARHAGKVKK
jgi:ankyrin repeat protein